MTKKFEKKVITDKIVDTRMYRYIYETYADRAEIQRLPIGYLNTTKSISGWETVKIYQ